MSRAALPPIKSVGGGGAVLPPIKSAKSVDLAAMTETAESMNDKEHQLITIAAGSCYE